MISINARISMSSHSGADIEVVSEDGQTIVNKVVKTDIDRSTRSIKKQSQFSNVYTSKYNICSVPINYEIKQGTIFAKMPYIEGIGGNQIAINGNKTLANNIKVTLNHYLINSIANSKESTLPKSVIIEKIKDIQSNPIDSDIQPEFNLLCTTIINNINDELLIPLGSCHGDLTLSNMIVSQDHNLYIFDFLDSFIESPLQDVSKLIQDMKHCWSFRHENEALRLKAFIFCKAAYPDFINILYRMYFHEIQILNLLTILRIAPYISQNDRMTIQWFKKTSQDMLNCTQFNTQHSPSLHKVSKK